MVRAYVEMPLSGKHGSGLHTKIDIDVYDWCSARKISTASHGYAQVWAGDHVDTLHRVVMGLRPGDAGVVDHINRDRLDNRRCNLRVGDHALNRGNLTVREPFTRGTTLHPDGCRWIAQGKKNKRHYYLGVYDSRFEAWRVAEDWRIANLPHYIPESEDQF